MPHADSPAASTADVGGEGIIPSLSSPSFSAQRSPIRPLPRIETHDTFEHIPNGTRVTRTTTTTEVTDDWYEITTRTKLVTTTLTTTTCDTRVTACKIVSPGTDTFLPSNNRARIAAAGVVSRCTTSIGRAEHGPPFPSHRGPVSWDAWKPPSALFSPPTLFDPYTPDASDAPVAPHALAEAIEVQPVVLDHTAYPVAFDRIIAAAHPKALINLRGTSKAITSRVDALLCRHVKVDMMSLRSRYTCLWLPEGDPRVAAIVSIDLDTVTDFTQDHDLQPYHHEATLRTVRDFAHLLKHLRLIRFSSLTYQVQKSLDALLPHTPNPWIAIRHEGSPLYAHPWSQGQLLEVDLSLANTGAQNVAINLAFNLENTLMGQSSVTINLNLPNSHQGQTYYIFITRYTYKKTHFRKPFEPMPPVKPRLLNTLIESIVGQPAKIILVGSEGWDSQFLGHKHTFDGTFFEEPDSNTLLQDRIRWWIRARAGSKFDTPQAVNKAIANIQLISWEEFKQHVPTGEMFDLMVDSEQW